MRPGGLLYEERGKLSFQNKQDPMQDQLLGKIGLGHFVHRVESQGKKIKALSFIALLLFRERRLTHD